MYVSLGHVFTFSLIEIKAIVTAAPRHTLYLKPCGNHVAGSAYRAHSVYIIDVSLQVTKCKQGGGLPSNLSFDKQYWADYYPT
jgi:hypothetical protein